MAGDVLAFKAQLKTFDELLRGRLDLVTQETALVVMENVVVGGEYGPGSPVDTGYFRSAWVVGINDVPVGGDPTGRARTTDDGEGPLYPIAMPSEMTLALAGVKAGDVITGLNPAVYGIPLEYGHSPQAESPPGIVRGVLAQGQAIVDAVVAKVKALG